MFNKSHIAPIHPITTFKAQDVKKLSGSCSEVLIWERCLSNLLAKKICH